MKQAHPNRQSPPLRSIWRRIDRVFCVSLADRTDRRASARAQFTHVELDDRVDFFMARRMPGDCERGIFESHRTCLERGLKAGARHMLIFEDDVVFGKIKAHRLSGGLDYFMNSDAPVLFLGAIVGRSRPTEARGVRRVRYRCLAHAYLIKAHLARRIVDQSWTGIPIDNLLSHCTDRHLALYPSIAYQSDSPSDNTRHQALEAMRRRIGGLRRIQIANEHYHRFRPAVIAVHLLAIGGLILWILS